MPRTATLDERFWEKVDKSGPVHPRRLKSPEYNRRQWQRQLRLRAG